MAPTPLRGRSRQLAIRRRKGLEISRPNANDSVLSEVGAMGGKSAIPRDSWRELGRVVKGDYSEERDEPAVERFLTEQLNVRDVRRRR